MRAIEYYVFTALLTAAKQPSFEIMSKFESIQWNLKLRKENKLVLGPITIIFFKYNSMKCQKVIS